MKRAWAILVLLLVGTEAGRAAAFQNLDFESANLPVIPYGQYGDYVPISQALPGWNAFLGTNPITQVLHNSVTLGSAGIWVWGPDWPYGTGGRIEGDFTAILEAGSASSGPPLSINQRGFVPSDSNWLLFKGRVGFLPPMPTVFSVSLSDQILPVTVLATYPDYSLYGAEISSFAGSEVELKFTLYRGLGNGLDLDSITFVPEPGPGSLALLALGLFGAACLHRRHARWPRP